MTVIGLDQIHDAGLFDLDPPRQLLGLAPMTPCAPPPESGSRTTEGCGRGRCAPDWSARKARSRVCRRRSPCARARNRASATGRARTSASICGSVSRPTVVDQRRAWHSRDRIAHRRVRAASDRRTARRACAIGSPRNRRPARNTRAPVAHHVARAGADQQRRLCVGNDALRILARCLREAARSIRAGVRRCRALRKSPETVEHVFALRARMRRLVNSH
jgi:hypothetical protein